MWAFGSRQLLGFHRLSEPAPPQGLWGTGLEHVLPALFLKGLCRNGSDSLLVVLAEKGSRAVVSP